MTTPPSITAGTATDVLDNDGNQITGFGSDHANLTLQNDGLIEAIGGTLILDTGAIAIRKRPRRRRQHPRASSSSSTLEIKSDVNNEATGQIDTFGGTVDFVGAATIIVNNLNTTNGIQINAGGTS